MCVSITCLPSFVQERKPRIHQRPSKSFDDAQGGVRQLLARIEEPQQRHRSVDDIADQKINLLDVNWKLFNDFANSVKFGTAPFKLSQRRWTWSGRLAKTKQAGSTPSSLLWRDQRVWMCCVTYENVAQVVVSATVSSSRSKNVAFVE